MQNRVGERASIFRLPFVRLAFPSISRQTIAIVVIGIGAAAVTAYVVAANLMLLDTTAIRKHESELQALEREAGDLRELVAQQQSPTWLTVRAAAVGLIEAADIHFIPEAATVALSPTAP